MQNKFGTYRQIAYLYKKIKRMSAKTLKLEESTARSLYKTASPELKNILEESFGKGFFYEKVTDRVQTIQDVLNLVGSDVRIPFTNPSSKAEKSLNAYALLQAITQAYNEGWTPDFTDPNQPKYYLYFEKKGSGWAVGVYDCVSRLAFAGFGLYFETREKALDAGKKFIDVWNDYLPE